MQLSDLIQPREGDCRSGGTIFNIQLAQNALDMLADRPGACADNHTDLVVSFALCDPR
jgi:hypothetical protein